jgi:hypothetical protein
MAALEAPAAAREIRCTMPLPEILTLTLALLLGVAEKLALCTTIQARIIRVQEALDALQRMLVGSFRPGSVDCMVMLHPRAVLFQLVSVGSIGSLCRDRLVANTIADPYEV